MSDEKKSTLQDQEVAPEMGPEEKLRQARLALGRELIKRDEDNEFWNKVARVGAFLKKEARRRFWFR